MPTFRPTRSRSRSVRALLPARRSRRAVPSPGPRPKLRARASFPITVIVTDNGTPALNDTETIQVTVNEVNVGAGSGGDREQDGQRVASSSTFTATATDADLPAQTLTFSLGAGAPAGAAITAGGNFTLDARPRRRAPFPVTVIVTDNGTPARTTPRRSTITVNERSNVAAGSGGDREPDGQRGRAPQLHGDRDRCRHSGEHAHVHARCRRSCRCGDHGGRHLHLDPDRSSGPWRRSRSRSS